MAVDRGVETVVEAGWGDLVDMPGRVEKGLLSCVTVGIEKNVCFKYIF